MCIGSTAAIILNKEQQLANAGGHAVRKFKMKNHKTPGHCPYINTTDATVAAAG